MKIILIVGTRPNFMKIAPIWQALIQHSDVFQPILVHTEQHYDDKMSQVFLKELKLPKPDYLLGVGSGSPAAQMAKIMASFEGVLLKEEPDMVLVVGDVTSTVACAMSAALYNIPVAHVEAGLRSRDRSMPEEINRLMTDPISDLLLTPSEDASENLRQEGIEEKRIHFVGNVMIDSLRLLESRADTSPILNGLGVTPGEYVFVTMHRASNVDDKNTLSGLLDALSQVQEYTRMVWPIHPRARKMIEQFGLGDVLANMSNTKMVDPIGYIDCLKLQKDAKFVLTDSGGLQEETTAFGVPCLTMRENTERPVTIEQGTNTLVGISPKRIVVEARAVVDGTYKTGCVPKLWDGKAAERIALVLKTYLS